MKTDVMTPSTPPAPPPTAVTVYNVLRPATKAGAAQIVIYGHSSLLYWWPVWLLCFILAGATYAERDRSGGVTVTDTNLPGLVFVMTLLAVVMSSTVLLRGMVSVVVIMGLITAGIALAWLGWWGNILTFLDGLEIRINALGYLCIGIPLFVGWVVVLCVYDRMHYVIFDHSQIRYVLEVGDGETVMPAEGTVVEKKRSDAFRHWVLGLGTGDLMIHSGGPNSPTIQLRNVLRIHRKLAVIDQMLREKAVTVA
ncbi:hypothetical protein [Fimbriiglobus ruber]|uniref:Uncharacterized protein n=1 Tax=Fimbriiglobus ruber TaxID=1908690 RepID=A0A225DTU9_9BACT|nr:hypothetical protein [Fimbriiglobus ruber]OWK39805.1 hypothetical protein FRUB_05695 [Fimbriiglobus ruber]